MNIIEIITRLLGSGDTVSKIASALGIGQEQASKAVSAAVPTILAGLAGAATKPGGGAAIANAIQQQDPNLLDNLPSLLSGGGEAVASQGSNILGSLLGGGGLGQLGSVLSRFTGVGEGGIGKLLGLLAPIVLGVIGKQSNGLDAGGITNLLASQKGNIAAALPPGLGSMLSSVPGLGGVLGNASNAVSSAGRTATHTVSNAGREVKEAGPSMMKWLVPLILVVAALFFLPKMCSRLSDSARVAKDRATEVATAASDSSKIISDATGLITSATTTVASIKDEASATAAKPKLQDITTKLGGLGSLMDKLPAPVQKSVGDALRPLIARLRDVAQPVLAMPLVGPQVKPTVDALLNQLERLVPGA